jgi:hypothetical protein
VVFWFIGVDAPIIKKVTYFKMSKQSERKFCIYIYIKTFYVGTQSFTRKEKLCGLTEKDKKYVS